MARALPSTVRATAAAAGWRQWRSVALKATAYLAMAGIVTIICLPLVWMAFASLKTRQEIYTLPISWIPKAFRWHNYSRAWNAIPFGQYYVSSLVVTAVGAGLKLTNATLTAYALVFIRFPKKNLVFLAVIAALMVPAQITLVPNYVLVSDLGWVNTYQGIIIPTAGVAIGTFLLRQQFLTIPREMIEAAALDGAGHLKTLWLVVIPTSRPAIVAVGLVAVVTEWNDYLWPLLVANTNSFRTLPVGLTALQNSEGATEWGVVMAGTVMVISPILLLFLWAQRHVIEGLTAGSVKG